MAIPMIRVCDAAALHDRGDGVRLAVEVAGQAATAFVVRFNGVAVGYLNQCAHVEMELDWLPGRFFNHEQTAIVCATHGAYYEPSSGRCLGGACMGRGGLRRLQIFEDAGSIWWRPDAFIRAPGSESPALGAW